MVELKISQAKTHHHAAKRSSTNSLICFPNTSEKPEISASQKTILKAFFDTPLFYTITNVLKMPHDAPMFPCLGSEMDI